MRLSSGSPRAGIVGLLLAAAFVLAPHSASAQEEITLAANINSGGGSSSPRDLTAFNGALYFRAITSAEGSELWKLNQDGEVSLVRDIRDGTAGSTPTGLTVIGDALYFRANDGTVNGLWKIDANGELSGPAAGLESPIDFVEFNETVYFRATSTDDGDTGIWKLNAQGQPEEIFPVNFPVFLTRFDDALYFRATSAETGTELWRLNSDHTAHVFDLVSGDAGSEPHGLIQAGDALFFAAEKVEFGPDVVWRLPVGGTPSAVDKVTVTVTPFGVLGDKLYVRGQFDGQSSLIEVDADGMASKVPGGATSASHFVAFNGSLYFSYSLRLWKVGPDGTSSQASDDIDISDSQFIEYEDALYFQGRDRSTNSPPKHLFKVTSGGEVSFVSNFGNNTFESTPEHFAAFNGAVFFGANGNDPMPPNAAVGQELWKLFVPPPTDDFGDLPTAYATLTVLDGGANDPARHVGEGPYLGSARDLERDGQPSDDAGFGGTDGDDGNGTDDDDGVSTLSPDPDGEVFAQFIAGSTVNLTVELSGGDHAYLQAWLDADGNGSFGVGERVLTDRVLNLGTNSVPVTVPSEVTTDGGAFRFRVTSYANATTAVNVDGAATDGEVEDYLVKVVASGAVSASTTDNVTVDGSDLVFRDGDGNETLRVPLTSVDGLTFEGTSGDDTITIDWGVVEAVSPVTVSLGEGFDTLVIDQGTGSPSDLTYTHTGPTSGTIVDASGRTLNFEGLDPIADNVDAANRSFTFSSADETITLSADGDGLAGNGTSFVDSDQAEEVSFVNPTASLTLDTGDGVNVVVLTPLDEDLDAGFTGLSVVGGAGPDRFTVTPTTYPIDIAAGGQDAGTCDALLLDPDSPAVVESFTIAAGSGTYTFSSGESPITFSGIEAVGEADLSVSASRNIVYATEELGSNNALVVTVVNEGQTDANCVTVKLSTSLSAWLEAAAADESAGTLAGTTWSVDSLAPGEEATLTITGFAVPQGPSTVDFTLTSSQDTNASNNVATVALSMGFLMPPGTQVNAALYFDKSVAGGSHDAFLVGLHQGAPGIDGALWCKTPATSTGTSWPTIPAGSVGNLYRPCSTGLPHPLHVNALLEDATGTLWLASWGSEGLYRSDDEGETWEAATILGGSGNQVVYDIAQAAGGGTLFASANNGLVLRSLDGGTTWQQTTGLSGIAAETPWSLAAHPTLGGTLYAGTHGRGVYLTRDFGFTWEPLDESGENDDLIAADAGHVFDLAFSPDTDAEDDHYLYAATGTGVWRAELEEDTASDFNSGWTSMGPSVTLHDASVVTPQFRALAFSGDGAGGAEDDLVAGSWGLGAFVWEAPLTSSVSAELALRGAQISVVAAAPDGQVFVGSSAGTNALVDVVSAVGTANQHGGAPLPSDYALTQNYPNPFNPVTTIGFALPEPGPVRLGVFDALGREVARLASGVLEAGHHEVQFDARSLPSGTYLYRLETGQGAITRTLILLK